MRLVDDRRHRRGVLDDEYRYVRFPGADLLATCRPRGLPIGNLTSQFWSNWYLHPLDQFVTRELGCCAYLRYVDDFALLGDSKRELCAWKAACRPASRHPRDRAQVLPVDAGIFWLGFVVFPTHRLIKARKVRSAQRRLRARLMAYYEGEISFSIHHVGHTIAGGLRRHVLEALVIRPAYTAEIGGWR